MEESGTPTAAIEQLYDSYHQPLLRYLQRLVTNQETAEDLLHETFIKAFMHWHELNSAAATRGWLSRIATITAYDYLRRRRLVEMLPMTDAHASTFAAPDMVKRLDDA